MADPKQLRIAACDAGSKGHIHWQEYMADAADQIERLEAMVEMLKGIEAEASDSAHDYTEAEKEISRLQAAADANICCPECGFVAPAKDWEITTPAGSDD